jgi:hypothetical protein
MSIHIHPHECGYVEPQPHDRRQAPLPVVLYPLSQPIHGPVGVNGCDTVHMTGRLEKGLCTFKPYAAMCSNDHLFLSTSLESKPSPWPNLPPSPLLLASSLSSSPQGPRRLCSKKRSCRGPATISTSSSRTGRPFCASRAKYGQSAGGKRSTTCRGIISSTSSKSCSICTRPSRLKTRKGRRLWKSGMPSNVCVLAWQKGERG